MSRLLENGVIPTRQQLETLIRTNQEYIRCINGYIRFTYPDVVALAEQDIAEAKLLLLIMEK